jgi:hypothetical protein
MPLQDVLVPNAPTVQAFPHEPQLASVFVNVSQPLTRLGSQSPHPLRHAATHRPAGQEAVPLGTPAQSPTVVQALPVMHPGQPPPPQSASVSVPFLTRSVHEGAWQTLPLQTAL